MQFNLDVEELDIAQRELDHWRRDPLCPMIIEVPLCTTSQTTIMDDSAGQGSVQLSMPPHGLKERIPGDAALHKLQLRAARAVWHAGICCRLAGAVGSKESEMLASQVYVQPWTGRSTVQQVNVQAGDASQGRQPLIIIY